MKIKVMVLLCAFLQAAWLIAQDQKPRIAIKTFDNPPAYQNSTIGNAVTDILTTEIGKTGKYRLVEREAVAELMKEINFGTTEWSKSPTFVQKGGFTGADFFLLGKITNFGFKEETVREQVATNRGAEWVTVYQQIADVRVDFRMVSTKTGEAVLTEAGKAHKANTSYSSELAIWNRFTASGASITTEFSSSLIGRAAEEAIRDIVRKLTDLYSELGTYTSKESMESGLQHLGEAEGKILAELGQEVFVVSLGSDNGVAKGDRLKVFSEILTRNKKGEVIYQEQKEAGSLEVIDVSMKDRAKARFLGDLSGRNSQAPPPRESDVVKIDLEYARMLRGAAKGGSAGIPDNPGGPGGPRGNEADYQAPLKKGNRFFEDEYYPQALEQYQKALAISPGNPEVLDRLATTQLFLRDFMEAEATIEKILDHGSAATVPVAHNHALSFCLGQLVIEKGQLSLRTEKGEHDFKATAGDLVSVTEETLFHLPSIRILWRSSDGKERRYDLLLYGYLRKNPGQHYISRAFLGTRETLQDTAKANRLLLRLVQRYVK